MKKVKDNGNNKKAIINEELKKKLKNVKMSNGCYYEGCGADDGWPVR